MTDKKKRQSRKKALRKKQKEILLQKTSVLKKERKKTQRKQILDFLCVVIVGTIILADHVLYLIEFIFYIFKFITKG